MLGGNLPNAYCTGYIAHLIISSLPYYLLLLAHNVVSTCGSEKECNETRIQLWFQTYTTYYSDITLVLLMHNLRILTASKTQIMESECSACLSAGFVVKEMVRHQRYKDKTGNFPVPVGGEVIMIIHILAGYNRALRLCLNFTDTIA